MKQENKTFQNIVIRPSTRNGTNSQTDPLVKQEEEEEETRLKRNLRSEEAQSVVLEDSLQVCLLETENYCNLCDKRFIRFRNYQFHMRHNHTREKITYYCDQCNKQYKTKGNYRIHMKNIHNVTTLASTKNSRILYPDLIPDINDPNCYCNACDYTFVSRTTYRFHLRAIHKVKFPDLSSRTTQCPDKTPDINDVNNYCIACDHTYKNKKYFRTHMLSIHNIGPSTNESIDDDSVPNIDDPNYHCSVCDRIYSCKKSYRLHILRRHPKTREMLKARLPHCNHHDDNCNLNCSF